MAGRVKHMERSHRSYRRNQGVFTDFHRNAFKVQSAREQRLTLGQRFAQLLRPLVHRTADK